MTAAEPASEGVQIAPVPRVAIQAFCETPDVAEAMTAAAADRRMNKAHVKVQMGGGRGAVEAFRNAPTPNVIVIEAQGDREDLLEALDLLSQVCDAGTKVVVIGHVNDVVLYRELMRRGVSDYLIAPVDPVGVLRAMSDLFTTPGADPVGRSIAVVGAKGGVGASTVCHNVGWAVARGLKLPAVVADLDIAFGTAGLDFNQDPPQTISDALFSPDRIDSNLIERLLSKLSDNLSLLAAPAMLDRTCDFSETLVDPVIDILRQSVPCVMLDVPHVWSAWTRRVLVSADDIVIVATPELASLRNAKNLYDTLKAARPNDKLPKIVLSQTGIPKRPEIAVGDFAKAVGASVTMSIPFDPALFGSAANNGQMIAEVQPSGKAAELFADLAGQLMGRAETRRSRRTLLEPLMARLSGRKAS